jgi:hypothetical protein
MKDNSKVTTTAVAVLTAAAVTGILSGAALAAGPAQSIQSPSTPLADAEKKGKEAPKKGPVKYKHLCKGKNDCKGKGGCKTGDKGCRGKNTCKGKGGCAVPIEE